MASASWLIARGLYPKEPKWFVEIDLHAAPRRADTSDADGEPTLFRIEIYAEEWGFLFRHGGRLSWIHVTDTRFAHGRDEYELLADAPRLTRVGALLKDLEARFAIRFDRAHPTVRTNIENADELIASWAVGL
jgi:hypothetical protein